MREIELKLSRRNFIIFYESSETRFKVFLEELFEIQTHAMSDLAFKFK